LTELFKRALVLLLNCKDIYFSEPSGWLSNEKPDKKSDFFAYFCT